MILIDREALCQDLLDRWSVADEKEESEIQNVMADVVTPIVFSQPTIEVPSWIPCSDRLPEPLKAVLITWINDNPPEYYASMKGVPFIYEAFLYDGKWYWWSPTAIDIVAEYGERCFEDLISEDIEVIAWMPLPEPYEGQTERSK